MRRGVRGHRRRPPAATRRPGRAGAAADARPREVTHDGPAGRHRRDRPRGAAARRRADRRVRGRRAGRGRVPRLGPGRPAHQRRRTEPEPRLAPARLRARPPADGRSGPGVRAADARRHRDPRAVAGGQRSDHRRAGARPDRDAARRARRPASRAVDRRRRRRPGPRAWCAPAMVGLRRARPHGDPPLRRGLAAGRAPADRPLRPPGRGGEPTASEAASTSSAGCSPKPSSPRFPTPRNAQIVERADRLGLGCEP